MKALIKTKYIQLVPQELLLEYLTVIKKMVVMREMSIVRYGELDQERKKIHDQILQFANVSRDNFDFQYELAMFCEGLLE